MNQVYQYGDELFVTLDAMPRLRNLRTGLIIRPHIPFKYLGDMPQVGQVWVGKRSEGLKTVKGFAKGCVQIEFDWSGSAHKGEVPLEIFLENHYLRTEPNFHFATGHKDALNLKSADRRFTVAEWLRDYRVAIENLEQYCKADVEVEATVLDSVGLYMALDGTVWRLIKSGGGGHVIKNDSNGWKAFVTEKELRDVYRALPLPGQLWAKGSRYVTVDRVEDGRVYYTDGSSGLRRFLNEYAHMSELVGGRNREKLEQLTRGYDFGKQGLNDFGVQLQRCGRILRPAPKDKPNPVPVSVLCKPCHDFKKLEELASRYSGHVVKAASPTGRTKTKPEMQSFPTESTHCPLNTSTLNRLNAGNALDNWTKYRNTLGAKTRYANQRIKELSK